MNTMKTQTLLLCLSLVVLSAPLSAQTATTASEAQATQPLNLSLPREAWRSTALPLLGSGAEDPVARNLRPDAGRLSYGSGYELRQRGSSSNGHNQSGSGARSGAGGKGRGR